MRPSGKRSFSSKSNFVHFVLLCTVRGISHIAFRFPVLSLALALALFLVAVCWPVGSFGSTRLLRAATLIKAARLSFLSLLPVVVVVLAPCNNYSLGFVNISRNGSDLFVCRCPFMIQLFAARCLAPQEQLKLPQLLQSCKGKKMKKKPELETESG